MNFYILIQNIYSTNENPLILLKNMKYSFIGESDNDSISNLIAKLNSKSEIQYLFYNKKKLKNFLNEITKFIFKSNYELELFEKFCNFYNDIFSFKNLETYPFINQFIKSEELFTEKNQKIYIYISSKDIIYFNINQIESALNEKYKVFIEEFKELNSKYMISYDPLKLRNIFKKSLISLNNDISQKNNHIPNYMKIINRLVFHDSINYFEENMERLIENYNINFLFPELKIIYKFYIENKKLILNYCKSWIIFKYILKYFFEKMNQIQCLIYEIGILDQTCGPGNLLILEIRIFYIYEILKILNFRDSYLYGYLIQSFNLYWFAYSEDLRLEFFKKMFSLKNLNLVNIIFNNLDEILKINSTGFFNFYKSILKS